MGARGNQRGGEGCIAQCRREVSVRRRAAFRHAPEWGGVLAFNEFGHGTVALKPTPWGVVPKGEWTDHEDRLAAEWLGRARFSRSCRAGSANCGARPSIPSGDDVLAPP